MDTASINTHTTINEPRSAVRNNNPSITTTSCLFNKRERERPSYHVQAMKRIPPGHTRLNSYNRRHLEYQNKYKKHIFLGACINDTPRLTSFRAFPAL